MSTPASCSRLGVTPRVLRRGLFSVRSSGVSFHVTCLPERVRVEGCCGKVGGEDRADSTLGVATSLGAPSAILEVLVSFKMLSSVCAAPEELILMLEVI